MKTQIFFDEDFPESKMDLVQKATAFYLEDILLAHMGDKTKVEITFEYSTPRERKELEHDLADSIPAQGMLDATMYPEDKTNRKFVIEIHQKLPTGMLLRLIAHECVHVAQYVTGAMKDMEDADPDKWTKFHTMWKGEVYDERVISYWDQPWEIDAMGREWGLFIRFAEHGKFTKTKWFKESVISL